MFVIYVYIPRMQADLHPVDSCHQGIAPFVFRGSESISSYCRSLIYADCWRGCSSRCKSPPVAPAVFFIICCYRQACQLPPRSFITILTSSMIQCHSSPNGGFSQTPESWRISLHHSRVDQEAVLELSDFIFAYSSLSVH